MHYNSIGKPRISPAQHKYYVGRQIAVACTLTEMYDAAIQNTVRGLVVISYMEAVATMLCLLCSIAKNLEHSPLSICSNSAINQFEWTRHRGHDFCWLTRSFMGRPILPLTIFGTIKGKVTFCTRLHGPQPFFGLATGSACSYAEISWPSTLNWGSGDEIQNIIHSLPDETVIEFLDLFFRQCTSHGWFKKVKDPLLEYHLLV